MIDTSATGRRVSVFGFDINDAAQIRRIRNLLTLGHQVESYTMRRRGAKAQPDGDWPNVHLGETEHENLPARLLALFRALIVCLPHLRRIARSDVVIARNMDMLAVALTLCALWPGRRPPVIYECLDIHGSLTRQDRVGRLMRWIERRLLRRTDLLLVSSPRFVEDYFKPVQGFDGRWVLIKNKLWLGGGQIARPPVRRERTPDAPLVLGWVGTIRCRPSMEILLKTAESLGDRMQLHVHGIIHTHAVPDLKERLDRLPNAHYFGPFAYPDGLEEIYSACDLVWAQDLWQAGANSTWLLPNRVYEAGWFGCPSIAVEGTQTARKVAQLKMGWVIGDADADTLITLLQGLTDPDLAQARERLAAIEDPELRLFPGELQRAMDLAIAERARA